MEQKTSLIVVSKFETALNKSIAFYRQEVEIIHKRVNEVAYLIDSVIDLAERVHEEGDDGFGVDYLNQHLSWGQKKVLGEMLDENLPFESMSEELKRLGSALREMEAHLKDELRFKTPA